MVLDGTTYLFQDMVTFPSGWNSSHCPKCNGSSLTIHDSEAWTNTYTCNACKCLLFVMRADRMGGNWNEDVEIYIAMEKQPETTVTQEEAAILHKLTQHMNPERVARLGSLLEKQSPEPRDVDEVNGIFWVKIQLLIQLGAHLPEKAFTPEGEDFMMTMNLQHQYNEKGARAANNFNASRMVLGPDGKPAN